MELIDCLVKEQLFCWSKNSKPFKKFGCLTVMPNTKSLGRYLGHLHPVHIISQYVIYIQEPF